MPTWRRGELHGKPSARRESRGRLRCNLKGSRQTQRYNKQAVDLSFGRCTPLFVSISFSPCASLCRCLFLSVCMPSLSRCVFKAFEGTRSSPSLWLTISNSKTTRGLRSHKRREIARARNKQKERRQQEREETAREKGNGIFNRKEGPMPFVGASTNRRGWRGLRRDPALLRVPAALGPRSEAQVGPPPGAHRRRRSLGDQAELA